MTVKKCSKCLQDKDLEKDFTNPKRPWCRGCVSAYNAFWRRENREKAARYLAEWRKKTSKEKWRRYHELYRQTRILDDNETKVTCLDPDNEERVLFFDASGFSEDTRKALIRDLKKKAGLKKRPRKKDDSNKE